MTETFDFANHAHRRHNPLTGDWVLVSPHRNQRPWQGHSESVSTSNGSRYDTNCYLCPGNKRISGASNPDYASTFVFPNDFPALSANAAQHEDSDPLFRSRAEHGECRVVAYSPDHSQTLAELGPTAIEQVINCWAIQCEELGELFDWVQVFENKGEIMGCSMPHPHGQIWAQSQAPSLVAQEHQHQQAYQTQSGNRLLLDYALRELEQDTRVVAANKDWLAVVPYWAAWPFETLVLPKFPVSRLPELTQPQRASLGQLLAELLARYDNLFECSFPYSMGWHGAPYNAQESNQWQLHAHFYPPLLRSQTVRKFMVGYEMLAEPQRDITPEQAAAVLRALPTTHYKFKDQNP